MWAAAAAVGLIAVLAIASPVNAQEAYVSRQPDCQGNSPCYQDINLAMATEPSGTEIRITEVSYSEDVILTEDKAFTLSGGWNDRFTFQPSSTPIDTLTIENGIIVTENIVLVGTEP